MMLFTKFSIRLFTKKVPIFEKKFMKGKIVLITGATSGIGEGCARKFASQGSDIIVNGRNPEKVTALKAELEKTFGIKALALPFDVRDRTAMKLALDSLLKPWSDIDVLVNNAG